ncbi:MAG: ABC transporter permease [Treponema sp.]|jgi:osmoprotectant transport system permease protein|nr:ABC transporter permease [Treponema sp.]
MTLFQFISQNFSTIMFRLTEHIQLTGTAIIIAILIGVPMGIIISYVKPLNKPTLAVVNLVQAIPSLAMLGFLIPFLGIGARPAIFMVIVYSLLPIVKNTFAGLSNQNAEMLEAAKGIGMTQLQILFKIKLPLALPIIMAGVRISAVTSVGIVTIAAFIGAGGLGFIIHSGMQMANTNMVLAGAIPACILALTVDFLMSIVEKLVTPKSFRKNKNS